jgi:alpha-galactosidase
MTTSRRTFVKTALSAAGAGGVLPPVAHATSGSNSFQNMAEPPDRVSAETEDGIRSLERRGNSWEGGGILVDTIPAGGRLAVRLSAPHIAVRTLQLRWRRVPGAPLRFLGDHWERGYGDLEWRGLVPERPMPWYFLTHDGNAAHAYGVATGAAALAHWQVDAAGVSLFLDVRCGGRGVTLGDRTLDPATVVVRRGRGDETPFAAARAFCALLSPSPRLPRSPVFGGNSWYSAYQNISADVIREMSGTVASLSPSGTRPYMVIDSGWQGGIGLHAAAGGPWQVGNSDFPDMGRMAEEMRGLGVRPAIWTRPLLTMDRVPQSWCLAAGRFPSQDPGRVLDPSVPEALVLVARDTARFTREWRYDLLKHDFTTWDIFGAWGFEMGRSVTRDGWSFADRSRTSAEIVSALYKMIREAAGDALVLGCNTIGHLAAGLFELQRTGDDTSGREWERTRKMGVNTLAFRLPQHRAFFAADADCAAVTTEVPWPLARRWLDLVARSGTPLFVSHAKAALGTEQRDAIRAAFAAAAVPQTDAEPLDWLETTCPSRWRLGGQPASFDWSDEGAET